MSKSKTAITGLERLSVREEYRNRAQDPDIYCLSGREGRADLAAFVAKEILERMEIETANDVIDIGCGEGTFLKMCPQGKGGSRIGILPTLEEVERAQTFHKGTNVDIRLGLVEKLYFPNESFDRVICNGVLLLVPEPEKAVREMARIARPGALVFIGENPQVDEHPNNRFNTSLPVFLWNTLLKNGLRALLLATVEISKTIGRGEWGYLGAKKTFFISVEEFKAMGARYGLELLDAFPSPAPQNDGSIFVAKNRMDYFFRKQPQPVPRRNK